MLLYVFYIFLAERHTDRPLFARRKFANSHDRKPARERERERENHVSVLGKSKSNN